MSKMRCFQEIPIYIAEDHNEVLPPIFRCVGSRHLPVSNNVLIHFDSHPDMGVPETIKPEDFDDVHEMYNKLSIENWILPAAFMRVIDTIVWICPPWSHQIPEGIHKFFIGVNKTNRNIQVSCPEDYFSCDGTSCIESDLEEKREVSLVVIKLKTLDPNPIYDSKLIDDCLKEKSHFILDIDLDFFSTTNPFLSMYEKSDLYSKLKKIYCSDVRSTSRPGDPAHFDFSSRRSDTLKKLKDLTNYLETNRSTEGYDGIGRDFAGAFDAIKSSILHHYGRDEPVDWLVVHNAGVTCDLVAELPHHISTTQEIERLVSQAETILQRIRIPPTLVTVARSSHDDYCPPSQVDHIQSEVTAMLTRCLGGSDKLKIYHLY